MKNFLAGIQRQEIVENIATQSGKVGYALLWLIGVPLPLVVVLYFVFGK